MRAPPWSSHIPESNNSAQIPRRSRLHIALGANHKHERHGVRKRGKLVHPPLDGLADSVWVGRAVDDKEDAVRVFVELGADCFVVFGAANVPKVNFN